MADSPARQDQPSRLYGPGSRALQDELDSRRLADRLAELTIHDRLDDGDVALVKDQRTVWVSTVDADGWPDVSYKGGARGFVQVIDPGTLAIPSYDGNGMFRTLGNVSDNGRVALLFVDPERPWRMRVHGRGTVSLAAEDLAAFPGANAVLRVEILRIFPNCGRYIHQGEADSVDVPAVGHTPPVAGWKRIPQLAEVLPATDPARVDPA